MPRPSETIRESFLALIPRMIVLHEQVAKDVGLSSTELQALHVISLDASAVSPSEIATRTGLPRSTVTRVLDGLERRGLVRRETASDDQRRVLVTVDEHALAPVSERFDAYARAMRRVDKEFSPEELVVVARYWSALAVATDAELDASS